MKITDKSRPTKYLHELSFGSVFTVDQRFFMLSNHYEYENDMECVPHTCIDLEIGEMKKIMANTLVQKVDAELFIK